MNGARVVRLKGVTVHVRDSAEVQADECGFCNLTPTAAVEEMRQLSIGGKPFTICNGCGDQMAAEVHRQLSKRRAS